MSQVVNPTVISPVQKIRPMTLRPGSSVTMKPGDSIAHARAWWVPGIWLVHQASNNAFSGLQPNTCQFTHSSLFLIRIHHPGWLQHYGHGRSSVRTFFGLHVTEEEECRSENRRCSWRLDVQRSWWASFSAKSPPAPRALHPFRRQCGTTEHLDAPDKDCVNFDLAPKGMDPMTLIMLTFDVGPTQKVFSDMVSTKENRATFIENLFAFMRQYAFDGVDFDWVRGFLRLVQPFTFESEVKLT